MCESGFECRPGAVEELAALGAEAIAPGVEDCWEGFGGGFGRAAAGDGEEVGETETAPRGVQDGEPGDAVGGMQQSAGEGEGVEDFGTVVEGFDFEGAEGDGLVGGVGAVEFGDDAGEVGAGAGKDGDAPRVCTAFGEWPGAPGLDDAADMAGFFEGVEAAVAFGVGDGCGCERKARG